MTIRTKLYAAIVLTVLGPLVTIGVALHGQAELGDSFEEVRDRWPSTTRETTPAGAWWP